MSTIKVTNLRHENATSDNITLDSSGNVSAAGNLSVTGTTTLTDDLNVDSGSLFVDASADRVGVGTNAPDSPVHIKGTAQMFPRVETTSTTNDAGWKIKNGTREWSTFVNGGDGAYRIYDETASAERLRIDNAGKALFSTSTNTQAIIVDSSSTSIATRLVDIESSRSASSAYDFLAGLSGNGVDVEHRLRGDGNALCDGSFTGGGADYAEYFEWSDSNPDEEDRRGISVVLDQDRIREAVAGEDPIGVISGNPSVVGDAAWNKWDGKYLRDDFGTYIQEDYEVEDEDGNTVVQQRRTLNPVYDPDVEYVNRENRPEWDCVGLMGKLRIRKGQVTGARWIKMRDVSDSVEEWLVR